MVQLGLVHIVVGVIQIVHRSHLLKFFKIFSKRFRFAMLISPIGRGTVY